MPQRTHTPLHTGDESPSCGLCSRRARLKLTAPTATLDAPSPISSTESSRRLPIIWPLVHILLRSSFLPGQRGKPTIHLLPSTRLLTPSARYQTPNFSFFTGDALCTRTGFPGPETPFPDRVRSRAAPPPARSDRGRRRISPVGGQSPGESSLVERAFKKGPEAWGSQGARSPAPESGAVQSSAASQVSAGKSRSLCFRDPFRLPLLSPPSSRASLPQIPSGTAQSISRPLAWSPSFVFVLTRGASTSPSVPRLSGRMIFSTTLLTVAVSPEKATLSDGLFPSGFLLPRRRPPPLPLSGSDSLSLQ